MAANISFFSTKALDFVASRGPEIGLTCIVETHVSKQHVTDK